LKILGLQIDGLQDKGQQLPESAFSVLNLVPPVSNEEPEQDGSDPWMQTATQIRTNLEEMASWIRSKQSEYLSLEMRDDEASLIQSTVTSFVATTATEIESLHKIIDQTTSPQYQQHSNGIVQNLMERLKLEIAEPFARFQKYRNRVAVDLWQRPLQCRFVVSRSDQTDELLGLDDNRDQRFQPKRPTHRLHRDFLRSYEAPVTIPQRPQSLFRKRSSNFQVTDTRKEEGVSLARRKASQTPQIIQGDEVHEYEERQAADIQLESALLQAKLHNDLDSVQKMEQMMVDITTLLSQFADLVAEQSEEVWEIHETTASSKENIEKGHENLVDAKERTVNSRHSMAMAISAMGILLLIFHWLRD
jgi:hypothetical protein